MERCEGCHDGVERERRGGVMPADGSQIGGGERRGVLRRSNIFLSVMIKGGRQW